MKISLFLTIIKWIEMFPKICILNAEISLLYTCYLLLLGNRKGYGNLNRYRKNR